MEAEFDQKTVVVIGNGMVGYKFCEKLIKKTNAFRIVVFGEEPRRAYDRVHLSEYFNGKTADDLSMSAENWYEENGIQLYLSDPVQEIKLSEKKIHSRNGITIDYDFLVMATGSGAFVPNIPGVEKEGVFVYRTIEDLELMKNYASKSKSGAVMGGGLLGLEAAKALMDLGIKEAHVVEFAPRLMPRQIDSAGSNLLQTKLKTLGLNIHLGKNTSEIAGEHKLESLKFNDETELKIDMLVISAGIRPRDELAKLSGLQVGTRGGIIVNEKMQTSNEFVYAIG
ncbi:MAG: NAD(P)/FAD-dependent oxidoreductase, partial [Sphingobacteriaceae bacterium]